jgi:restriction system protein
MRFFGALHGQRATKGVFITTSSFSKEAMDYADGVTPTVILVDGKEPAQLMIEHAVGVTVARRYEVKRLDLDYFVTDDEEVQAEPGAGTAAETPATNPPTSEGQGS